MFADGDQGLSESGLPKERPERRGFSASLAQKIPSLRRARQLFCAKVEESSQRRRYAYAILGVPDRWPEQFLQRKTAEARV